MTQPSPTFSGKALAPDQPRTAPSRTGPSIPFTWTRTPTPQPRIYHLAVGQDDDSGAFTAYCLELPGAVAEADDAETACVQLKAVVEALIDEYRASGDSVPWQPQPLDEGFEVVATITVERVG